MKTKVVLEGVRVRGKTLREHYEIINHHQALVLIEDFAKTYNLLMNMKSSQSIFYR